MSIGHQIKSDFESAIIKPSTQALNRLTSSASSGFQSINNIKPLVPASGSNQTTYMRKFESEDSDDALDDEAWEKPRSDSTRFEKQLAELETQVLSRKGIVNHDLIDNILNNCASHSISSENSYVFNILKSVKHQYLSLTGQLSKFPNFTDYNRVSGNGNNIIAKSLQKPMKNYFLTMSRSFRVGFSQFGHIAHPGNPFLQGKKDQFVKVTGFAAISRIVVEKIQPLQWISLRTQDHLANTLNILEAIHNSSNIVGFDHNSSQMPTLNDYQLYMPFWKTPECCILNNSKFTTYMQTLETLICLLNPLKDKNSDSNRPLPSWYMSKALELLHASLHQENKSLSTVNDEIDDSAYMPYFEEAKGISSSTQLERRKVSLKNWFSSLATALSCDSGQIKSAESKDDELQDFDNEYDRIFHALIHLQINQAVKIAEDSGNFRLGSILSQLSGDQTILHLIRYQLDLWKSLDAFDVIPNSVIRVYRLIAADFFPSDMWDDSILSDVDWIHSVGALYFFSELDVETNQSGSRGSV